MTERLPASIPVQLPEELTRLEWVDAMTVATREFLVRDGANGQHEATEDPGERQILAVRTRWSIGGTAVGAHHELGTVTLKSGETPTTRIAYVVLYTPWISADVADAYFGGV